jgi:hypothetical protein
MNLILIIKYSATPKCILFPKKLNVEFLSSSLGILDWSWCLLWALRPYALCFFTPGGCWALHGRSEPCSDFPAVRLLSHLPGRRKKQLQTGTVIRGWQTPRHWYIRGDAHTWNPSYSGGREGRVGITVPGRERFLLPRAVLRWETYFNRVALSMWFP